MKFVFKNERMGWITSHIWWFMLITSYNNTQNSRILFNWMCKKPWGTHTHTKKKTWNKLDRSRVLSHSFTTDANAPFLFEMRVCFTDWHCSSWPSRVVHDYRIIFRILDSVSSLTINLLGIWSRLCYSFCFLFFTSYLVNPVDFSIHLERGTWGGGANAVKPQKKLTNTASPLERSTKHRHHRKL